jgi:hypothetical protein
MLLRYTRFAAVCYLTRLYSPDVFSQNYAAKTFMDLYCAAHAHRLAVLAHFLT